MKLKIQTITGVTRDVDVEEGWTVKDLKVGTIFKTIIRTNPRNRSSDFPGKSHVFFKFLF